jgi:hypothetical protein
MIRIAVSAEAYFAIRASLPEGAIIYPPDRERRGQYLLWLTASEAARLSAFRLPGESFSDAILRLVESVSGAART